MSEYKLNYKDVDYVIEYEAVPPERGSRGSMGEQLEPDYDGYIEVEAVYVEGSSHCIIDIMDQDILSEWSKTIEKDLSEQYEDDSGDYEYHAKLERIIELNEPWRL